MEGWGPPPGTEAERLPQGERGEERRESGLSRSVGDASALSRQNSKLRLTAGERGDREGRGEEEVG